MNKQESRNAPGRRLLLSAVTVIVMLLQGCALPYVGVILTSSSVAVVQGESVTVAARTGTPFCPEPDVSPPCADVSGLIFDYDFSGVPDGMNIVVDTSLQSPATPGLVRLAIATDPTLAPGVYPLAIHAILQGASVGSAALSVAVLAAGPSESMDVVDVGAGSDRSFAILHDGTALAWGANGDGELGLGVAHGSTVPRPIPRLTDILAIGGDRSSFGRRSAAVAGDGSLWMWGDNNRGRLIEGLPETVILAHRHPALSDVVATAIGALHTLALTQDGTVHAWGDNGSGQLGEDSVNARTAPAPVPGLPPVRRIAAGSYLSLALDHDGHVWAWGSNTRGQLGRGGTFNGQSSSTPTRVPGVDHVVDITAGSGFALAHLDDGTLLAWGENEFAQLADSSLVSRSTAAPLAGLDQVVDTAAGISFGLALRADGTLWGWGHNSAGQILKEPLTEDRLQRVPMPIAGVSDITRIAAGDNHTLALTGCGQLVTFGDGEHGERGDGSTPIFLDTRAHVIPGTGRPGECDTPVLQVAKAGSGADHGGVTSSDLTLSCEDPHGCLVYSTIKVPRATPFTLEARAQAGAQFVRWAGDCGSTSPVITLGIDAPTRCVAIFDSTAPESTLLSVSTDGGRISSSAADSNLGPEAIDCGDVCSAVFNRDSVVGLTARPDPGFRFRQWADDCTGTSTGTTVTMADSKHCEALFQAFELSLTVTGEGAVTGDPGGIACAAGTCTFTPRADPVTLTAQAAPGWMVGGWSGDCAGSGDTQQLAMTTDRACAVDFVRDPGQKFLTLEVIAGPGSVQSTPPGIDACRTSCTTLFATGSTIQLNATPDDGNRVLAWTGQCQAAGNASSPITLDTDTICGVVFVDIDDPQIPVAQFTRPPTTPRVGLPLRFDGSTSYVFDPDTGISDPLLIRSYEWDFDLDGIFDVGGNGTQARVVEHVFQTPGPKTVQLRVTGGTSGPGGSPGQAFEQRQFNVLEAEDPLDPLTISKSGAGTGQVRSVPAGLIDCDTACTTSAPVLFTRGTMIDLRAVPDTGSTFVSWHGHCGGNSPQTQVTLLGARHCLALFAVEVVTLQVSRLGDGQVTSFQTGIQCGSDCSENYDFGTPVTLTATPAQGFQFDGWSGSCSGTAPTILVTMNGDRNCHASFSPSLAMFTLSVGFLGGTPGRILVADPPGSTIDCGAVCSDVFPAGTMVRLRSEFVPGTFFGGWALGCDAIVDQQCVVTMTNDRAVTAIFE